MGSSRLTLSVDCAPDSVVKLHTVLLPLHQGIGLKRNQIPSSPFVKGISILFFEAIPRNLRHYSRLES